MMLSSVASVGGCGGVELGADFPTPVRQQQWPASNSVPGAVLSLVTILSMSAEINTSYITNYNLLQLLTIIL